MTVNAHFDGRAMIPDEPLDLRPNQALIVQIELIAARRKSRRWHGSPPMRLTATRYPPIWPINTIVTVQTPMVVDFGEGGGWALAGGGDGSEPQSVNS